MTLPNREVQNFELGQKTGSKSPVSQAGHHVLIVIHSLSLSNVPRAILEKILIGMPEKQGTRS